MNMKKKEESKKVLPLGLASEVGKGWSGLVEWLRTKVFLEKKVGWCEPLCVAEEWLQSNAVFHVK